MKPRYILPDTELRQQTTVTHNSSGFKEQGDC